MSGWIENGGLVALGSALGAGVMKLAGLWLEKRPTRADLLTAAQDAARDLMDGMRQDLDGLRKVVRDQTDQIDNLRRAHGECESRCLELTGQVRGQAQRIDSLLRQLSDPASTGPDGALRGALIEIDGEAVAVTRPNPRSRRKTP